MESLSPMTFPITITIASTEDDRLRAETPAGPVEATTMGELGDRLKEVLVRLEAELAAQEQGELAEISRSATDCSWFVAFSQKDVIEVLGHVPPDSMRRIEEEIRRYRTGVSR
jgi:hypothetical protein